LEILATTKMSQDGGRFDTFPANRYSLAGGGVVGFSLQKVMLSERPVGGTKGAAAGVVVGAPADSVDGAGVPDGPGPLSW